MGRARRSFPAPLSNPLVIDTDQQLASFVELLRGADWVAIDTEADSLHSYPEKLCLLQIAIPGHVDLVDVLAGSSLDPLWNVLKGRELLMHGADYDLRLLKGGHDFVPTSIFDTMLAARLVGRPRFGLGDLVQDYLGISLEKSSQKANWARRPLTPKMTEYALNDARYLEPLVEKLRSELRAKGREGWHQQECAQLIVDNTRLTGPDPERVWRIKGSNKLQPHALAILRELWHWREKEAARLDRPPFFVLAHDRMIGLADAASNGQTLDHLLPRRISPRRREAILNAIKKGKSVPEDECPQRIKSAQRRNVSGQQKKRFGELINRRDQHAESLGIDPTLIANRATLMALANSVEENADNLLGWQREILAI